MMYTQDPYPVSEGQYVCFVGVETVCVYDR